MRLTKDNDLIQALATQRTDQAFGKTILPWRPRRNRPVTDTHCPEPSQKDVPIGAIVVAYTQTVRKIAINTGYLQGCTRQKFSYFHQGSIAQPSIITPQNKIDQPLSFEEPHCFRMK
jgi:hypothetical protein